MRRARWETPGVPKRQARQAPAADSDTVAITVNAVNAVNDAPVNTVPGAQTVAEDTALALSGAALISVVDVDGNLANVGLTVANGTLSVTLGTTGANVSARF